MRNKCCLAALLPVCVVLLFAGSIAFALAPEASRFALDADLPFMQFLMAHGRAEAAAQSKPELSNMTLTALPSIAIYSPAGELIYEGGGEIRDQNLAVLEAMPGSVEHLAALPAKPKLPAMLEIVPGFQAHKEEIAKRHHYLVYAVEFLQGPQNGPTSTEKAILALRARGADLPIDTLLLKLQP